MIPSVEETAALPVYAEGKWLALEPSAGLGLRFSKPHPPAQQSSWVASSPLTLGFPLCISFVLDHLLPGPVCFSLVYPSSGGAHPPLVPWEKGAWEVSFLNSCMSEDVFVLPFLLADSLTCTELWIGSNFSSTFRRHYSDNLLVPELLLSTLEATLFSLSGASVQILGIIGWSSKLSSFSPHLLSVSFVFFLLLPGRFPQYFLLTLRILKNFCCHIFNLQELFVLQVSFLMRAGSPYIAEDFHYSIWKLFCPYIVSVSTNCIPTPPSCLDLCPLFYFILFYLFN